MITIIYDKKKNIIENVLEPVKFVEDAVYLNLFYHKLNYQQREISDYIGFNKYTKNGYLLKIGDKVFKPAQIIENPEYILALMKQDLLKQTLEKLP